MECRRIVCALLLSGLVCFGHSWDLRSVGIDQFRVRHVSLYHSRAFLTIESHNVSLVEATWPENTGNQRPRVLSSDVDDRSCRGVRHVLGTDIDRLARLWVLCGVRHSDCPPKLIIRSLLSPSTGEIHHRFRRTDSDQRLHAIAVDPVPASDGDTRAFITLVDEDYILLYSLFKRTMGKLRFEKNDLTSLHPISLSEVSVNNNRLYVADTVSDRLFALPIRNLRQLAFPEDGVQKIIMKTNVTYIGRLLGRPCGLKLDFRDNLLYVLQRDGAIVKWTPGRSLKAENHRVILQQGTNITQIILGIAGNAWAVSGEYVSLETRRHCMKINV
uniref:Adipocyte plasma membrane-associated protein n=1 Tax=Anopheles dirus TaxID=7168 RepID=A0A182N360_9DIPT